MAIASPGPVDDRPLVEIKTARPDAGPGEILARVSVCGVCRTDLHIAEGDLKLRRPRIIPGHEIVARVERLGPDCKRLRVGDRVGIAWLRATCGQCGYCRRGRENLCPNARFTGYDEDGGYAEYAVVREDFAYRLPETLGDEEAAPLLCAGIIGYRALKRAEVRPGATLGLYGFGGSAHIAIQIARFWGCRVFVMTRGGGHRQLAEAMNADWVGAASDRPPAPLDSAILFAPAGDLVPAALRALDRGGILAVAGIHLSPIPQLDYERDLFQERELRSVTANTRADAEEFIALAGRIPIRTHTRSFELAEANMALGMLKHDEIQGAGVLRIG